MKKWIGFLILGAPLLAGCAEFRERQRLKTEMMREAVGMMKGMHGAFLGAPPGAVMESATPVAAH